MKKVLIERRQNITPADFHHDHIQGMGKPVIITDATEGWPACSKWTFDFFKSAYGSDFATASHGLSGDIAKMTKLATYIDCLDTPDQLPGFWVNMQEMRPLQTAPEPTTLPPYLTGWHAFQRHPELYEDIKPAPYFISDWTLGLDRAIRDLLQFTCGRNYWTLFIGPTGSLSDLHQDFWHTHSYLAQVHGIKRVILFSPEDSQFLYDGRVDPEQPDFEQFALFDKATMYEGVIEPGDILFTPPNWWHCVRALENSITVSHNFFNEVNFSEHLVRLIRKLPTLANVVDETSVLREALQINWRSKGFAKLDA